MSLGAKVTGLESNHQRHRREREKTKPATVPVLRGRKVGRGKRMSRRR